MNGYPIAAEALDLELYTLGALFASRERIDKIGKKRQRFRFLQDTFEFSELSRRLISVAVMLRSHIDNRDAKADTSVGNFIDETNRCLTLREACNKVIHAEDIEFGCTESGQEAKIRLYGTRGEQAWTVEIDIYDFIEKGFQFT